ncbi:hypothetical protein OG342_21215 [Streptomyces bobili]|uniref:hypothetical protein n=1 Tax=Streptomyces bobili TaxID=67280 RepID=UPI00224F491E|nr:hypothetical protein [Streptomyces bobili]MCX5525341.1 hypothetical protein [Streptomyces bobili]
MGFMGVWSVLPVVGAVGGVAGGVACGVVAGRRSRRDRSPSGLDAEAEANQWLVRLAGGLGPPDVRAWAGAGEDTARALTSAAECHRAARARLATARTAAEYAEVTRTAREGLDHLGRARAGLGRETVTVSTAAG